MALPWVYWKANVAQFVNNLLGALQTWVLAAVATYIILKIVDVTVGLRVDESGEVKGLDVTQHGEEAYGLEG
jgi:Amt family ammonium transporter